MDVGWLSTAGVCVVLCAVQPAGGWWCWARWCALSLPLRLSHPPIAAGRGVGGCLHPLAYLSLNLNPRLSSPLRPRLVLQIVLVRDQVVSLFASLSVPSVSRPCRPTHLQIHGFVLPAALHVISAAVAAAAKHLQHQSLTHAIANHQPPPLLPKIKDIQQSATNTNTHPKWRTLPSLSLSPTTAIGRRPRSTPDRPHRPTRARRARRSRPQRRRLGPPRSRRCCTLDGRVC